MQSTLNLCSYSDKNYLRKLMALYKSLERHAGDYSLYVLALDDEIYSYLVNRRLPHMTVSHLDDFESGDLLIAKSNRSWLEYMWTLTPAWTKRVMDIHQLDHIAYVDADCYFFNDPQMVIDDYSIGIVPHRFANTDKERLLPNGKFNVGWVYFKNDDIGQACLAEWRNQCVAWCYNRNEDGKFADQKYLDEWPKKYCARAIEHLGFGLAPWNNCNYNYAYFDDGLYVSDYSEAKPIIMYHFHELLHDAHGNITRKTDWPIHPMVNKYVYEPYAAELKTAL